MLRPQGQAELQNLALLQYNTDTQMLSHTVAKMITIAYICRCLSV